MAIYMPPIGRKKKVIERYNPDTFRVISDHAEETHLKYDFVETNKPSDWRKKWLDNNGLALPNIYSKNTEVLPHVAPDWRINKPHPDSCGFLRNNVRFLNEPICSVYTDITKDEQHSWWPSRVSNEPLSVPPKTKDTTYRGDFTEREKSSSNFGSQRHTANPNTEPALGTVPVNFLRPKDNKQRLYKENISYEHQYNSRIDPNYPIRAKRHGSFVWDQMAPEASKKFINHYNVITSAEGVRRQEETDTNLQHQEIEKVAREAVKVLQETQNEMEVQPVVSPKQASPAQSAKVSPKHSPPRSRSCSGQVSPTQKDIVRARTEIPVVNTDVSGSNNVTKDLGTENKHE